LFARWGWSRNTGPFGWQNRRQTFGQVCSIDRARVNALDHPAAVDEHRCRNGKQPERSTRFTATIQSHGEFH
jgi:hypothetical protein